ncbi:MAG: DNA polymerase III subunit alpha [Patescibacteria group bacterium]
MFTHLHVHSHYSLLDGLPKIDDLVMRAKELGMHSLALTDHGVMYGLVEFYQKAKKIGIKPILGCEIYLAPYGMSQKRAKIDTKPYHLVLLCKNNEGYKNLIKIVTAAHLAGYYYKPRVDFEFLKNHAQGLIALTSCLEGEIPRLVLSGNLEKTAKRAKDYEQIFGKGNFYLEIQHHPGIAEQKIANQGMITISKKYNLPIVATCDSHYLMPADAEIQDILLCVQTQKKVAEKNRISMLDDDFSLRTPKEMAEIFKETPEAIANTEKIAKMCNLELEFGKIKLPKFEVPKPYNPDTYLKELAYHGLTKKYGIEIHKNTKTQKQENKLTAEILKRLEYELAVIEKTGFASYLLIVQDFVNWAKENKIVVGPGRGSAAGSLVCYLLNITEIDPIKYDLLFERFLNPERISMPDIDLDFADTRRDEVIEYVKNKYGKDHVARIITFGKMAARAAVRDVVRVLGYPYSFGDQIAKLIPMFMTISETCDKVYELKDLYQKDPDAKKILEYAKKLEGVARHASVHACGVVITPEPLDNYIPRQFASQDDKTVITQYEMHGIEDLGLLKMDFLGLKNLTIIQNTIKIIEKIHNIKNEIDKIPLDNKKTFELLQKGNTTGVFQLESAGMKRYLKQLKPTEFENIIAMISLYRPGPIEWIPEYILRKQGEKDITYIHPKLKRALEKTYGICVYQEQLMQIAQDVAGFTLAEADVLRKAVGKKIKHLLLEQKKKFIQGAMANNIPESIAQEIFSFIEPFAGYGFNKAHGTCYAMIAYQTAYLKAHYPAEFMAALLTSDQEDIDRIAIEIQECKEMGLEVLPPDVNESFTNFAVVKKDGKPVIRFGLNGIKNLGHDIASQIVEERKQNGKFKNFDDFIQRLASPKFNKKFLESLAKSGALDSLAERNQILQNTEKILNYSKNIQKTKSKGQVDLFGNLNSSASLQLRLDEAPPASKNERLSWERELLGLYVSEHPLAELKDYFDQKTTNCRQLKSKRGNEKVILGGVINKIKKILTRNSQTMLFVKIEDLAGEAEIIVFPKVLSKNPIIFQEDKIILVEGRTSDKNQEIKVLCDNARELTKEIVDGWRKTKNPKNSSILKLTIPQNATPDLLYKLKNIFEANPGPCEIILNIPDGTNSFKTIKAKTKTDTNKTVLEKVKSFVGRENVKIINPNIKA